MCRVQDHAFCQRHITFINVNIKVRGVKDLSLLLKCLCSSSGSHIKANASYFLKIPRNVVFSIDLKDMNHTQQQPIPYKIITIIIINITIIANKTFSICNIDH